ncbi:MAG: chorismate mutase [Clostridia bacterium]|nr:chorismate mutase [Clostridia bacterium]
MEKYRSQIDAIDDQIAKLYAERMELAKQIGIEKAKQNKAVDVPEREKAIINRLAGQVDEDKKIYLKQLYNTVFSTSKAYQSRFMRAESPLLTVIRNAAETCKDSPISATVACQGVEGAYSNIATEKMFELSDITFFKTFEGVFQAVDKNLCRYGVLPIENSTTGSILQVYDLMQKYKFFITKSVRVQISHALVAKPGTDLSKIKTVISHEQGILQCGTMIKECGFSTRVVENTAVAARTVAEGEDDTVAAICSAECASIYGLSVLRSNVQDSGNNYTRFICISKNLEIYNGANKISVMINAAHTPGSLSRILNRFAALGLNVTKIESRPIPNSDFEFLFYFDFEGNVFSKPIQNLIADLQNGTERFVFLGNYKESL